MSTYPWKPIKVDWKRPSIDKEILRHCMQRSDLLGLLHCLGTLGLLGASGAFAYLMFTTGHWVLLAVALYIHGGIHAFHPQVHELSHSSVFKNRWLNRLFKRAFGLVHWTSHNSALFKLSHVRHHQHTLHRQSDGEQVHPRAETTEQVLQSAINFIDVTGFMVAMYDQIYFLFVPFLRSARRSTWHRYVYHEADSQERRDVYWTQVSQFMLHVLFAIVAIVTGHWFLIVVVSLPAFYGAKWYEVLVHDTMHVGCQPETDDFRLCCRTVRLDPITSFLYWHMEYHTEHHAYAAVPCYRLRQLHRLTQEHWERPRSLTEAWKEMNNHSRKMLVMPEEAES